MLRLVTSRVLLGLTVVVTVLCFYMGRHLLGRVPTSQQLQKKEHEHSASNSQHEQQGAITLMDDDVLPLSPAQDRKVPPALPLDGPDMDAAALNSLFASTPGELSPTLKQPNTGPGIDTVCAHLVYGERRQRADNMCLKSRQGAVVSLVNYGKVSYCMVPKVGCTFWINVFRYLHNDTNGIKYPSPFHIPRVVTHYGQRQHLKFFSMSQGTPPEHLLSDFRFMFVRDPWSRLWSAYLDKFLLIDFWRTDGQQIVRRRKVKDASTRCARDVSFKEFVDFVVTSNPANLNPHWKPVQLQCSPCLYRPHVIGKMETFSQDVRFVLDKLDMTWMMDNYTHDAHVHGEMDMLIDYNFHMLGADFFKACTNATDLARRLWKTFQYNGYLPIESPFPEGQALSMTVPRFKSLVHSAYTNRPLRSPKQWRRQREQAMLDAYREIPAENIAKLQKLYQADFEMFDYDPSPPGTTDYVKEEPSCIIK